MSKQWYAVHTYAGQEDKVKQNVERRAGALGLDRRIAQVLVPTEEVMGSVGGKPVKKRKKVFPGYVLVEMEMDDETWHFVRQTVGVTGFLGQAAGSTARPTPLQSHEVAVLIGSGTDDNAHPVYRPVFHKGEQVNVTAGPFAGSEGRIDDVNPKTEKLVVMIALFGRETRVDIEFANVEKIS